MPKKSDSLYIKSTEGDAPVGQLRMNGPEDLNLYQKPVVKAPDVNSPTAPSTPVQGLHHSPPTIHAFVVNACTRLLNTRW